MRAPPHSHGLPPGHARLWLFTAVLGFSLSPHQSALAASDLTDLRRGDTLGIINGYEYPRETRDAFERGYRSARFHHEKDRIRQRWMTVTRAP
jgi:hypothetical protein